MSYQIDLSGRVALVTGRVERSRRAVRARPRQGRRRRRARRPPRRAAEEPARRDRGRRRRRPRRAARRHRPRRHQGSAVAHTETESARSTSWSTTRASRRRRSWSTSTPEDFDYVFDVNVRGAFFVAQEVGKRMIARAKGAAPGTFTGGRIVNIASMAGLRVLGRDRRLRDEQGRGRPHDASAMALEWGRYGINVNAICPGYIDTEINHHQWQTDIGQEVHREHAAEAHRQPGRPRHRADDAVRQREPLHQRRGRRGRRRLRAL